MNRQSDEDYFEVYEAPKNFKKGQYLLGKFTIKGIVVAVVSVVLTILIMVLYLSNVASPKFYVILLLLVPFAAITILLTPLPTYMNIFTLLLSKFRYKFSNKRYRWSGIAHNQRLSTDEIFANLEESEDVWE